MTPKATMPFYVPLNWCGERTTRWASPTNFIPLILTFSHPGEGTHTRYVNRLLVAALMLSGLSGCFLWAHGPFIDEHVGLIAVLPIERQAPSAVAAQEEGPRLEPHAEGVITAQVYAVLSESPQWRFVADLTATQALGKLGTAGDLATRAQALGKAVEADAVLCGTVTRYVERVGSEYGTRKPAAVGFTLQLISVSSGRTLWTGTFDQQQQALTTNLFNWWQFWRGGPKWFTAQEFAHLGVEHLLDDLGRKIRQEDNRRLDK